MVQPQQWAVATVSLGKHTSHTLERKLTAAANEGFEGIELFYNDLVEHAKQNQVTPLESAARVRTQCEDLRLSVLSLSPLKNFEGNLTIPWAERLDTARHWVELAAAAGAAYVQIPAQFLVQSTGDRDTVIPELQALAAVAAESSLGIAYESVAWARFQPTWQEALRTVELVGRPNFKLCVDSFHVHARLWGDICAEDGRISGGDEVVAKSMTEFVASCPKDKVAYLQLSDGSRFDPPLKDDSPLFDGLEVHEPSLVWSRTGRPFPLEAPGYLPVMQIAQSWLNDYRWAGWVSLEGFLDETMEESHGPEEMAVRARQSRDKVQHGLRYE